MSIEHWRRTVPRLVVCVGFSVLLGGCFQSASTPIAPTIVVNVTAAPVLTFTPAIIPTIGIAPNTVQPAATSANPATAPVDQSVTAAPTDQSAGHATAAPTDNSASSQPSPAITDAPFVTAIATGGFVTPDNGTALLVGTAAVGGVTPVSAATVDTSATQPILNTPTALATENPCTYTVRPNDHLVTIAAQVGVSLNALEAANPQLGSNPNALQIGEVLNVPGCGQPTAVPVSATSTATATLGTPGVQTYTVQAGDTLYTIAQHYNIPLASLESANKLTDQSVLQIGQTLVIPAK